MPYLIEFDAKNRIIRGRFEGRVTDEELKEYYREMTKYVALTGPCAGITDFSAATSFEVSSNTLRELASLRPAMPDMNLPRFIVAPSPVIFGLSRLFQIAGEVTRPNNHVVSTADQAFAALGVLEPEFEPIQSGETTA
jgi:hypothetical protein